MQNMHISHMRCRYALPQQVGPSRRKMNLGSGFGSNNPNQMPQNHNRGGMTDSVGDHDHQNENQNQNQNQMPRKGVFNFVNNGEQRVRQSMYYSRGQAHVQDSKQWRTQNPYTRCPRNGSLDKSISDANKEVKYPIVPLLFPPSGDLWTSANPELSAAAMALAKKGAGPDAGSRISLHSDIGLVPKPSWRTAPAVDQHLLAVKRFQLNAAAPVFQPGRRGYQGPAQALRETHVGVDITMGTDLDGLPFPETMTQRHHPTPRQHKRYRKQPLPDLFAPILALMRVSKRSVSYPEIINGLSVRLQRPEVELKRHVPHTLQLAVHNGYLSKQGNRYTMRSEKEHLEIMRLNKVADLRAKELEKEPLSWRKR